MSATIVASAPTVRGLDPERALALGRDVLATEADAIRALHGRLGAPFSPRRAALFDCRGRVISDRHRQIQAISRAARRDDGIDRHAGVLRARRRGRR
jgi:hypothetical protein